MRSGIPGDFKARKNVNKIKSSLFPDKRKIEERAYHFCKKRMRNFLKKPGKQSWSEFNVAYAKLAIANPSQANAIMAVAKKEMFNRAILQKNLQ